MIPSRSAASVDTGGVIARIVTATLSLEAWAGLLEQSIGGNRLVELLDLLR
jgi:hypothetical protein